MVTIAVLGSAARQCLSLFVAIVVAGLLATGGCAGPPVRPPQPPDRIEALRIGERKIANAIVATKRMIQRSRGADYLGDMYLRLAELYTEQARYAWLIAFELRAKRGEIGKAFDVPTARKLKNLAINTYDRVLADFPGFRRADEALFLKAHEHRELGDFPAMRAAYDELIKKHAKSRYRLQAYLILGDSEFEQRNLAKAEHYYKMVIAEGKDSGIASLARFKLAWVKLNYEPKDYKAAVKLFEQILQEKKTPTGSKTIVATQKSFDLRREALIDLAWCYPDVYQKKSPAPYFRQLATSSSDYLVAMRRLAERFDVREMHVQAAGAYREVLGHVAADPDAIGLARKLYDVTIKGAIYEGAEVTVDLFGRVLAARRHDFNSDEPTYRKLTEELEVYARDITTKVHLAAKEAKEKGSPKKELFATTAAAYQAYLEHFLGAKERREMEHNFAEVLVAAEQHWMAGSAFELVARNEADPEAKKKAWLEAFAAYQRALDAGKMPRRQKLAAWDGLRAVGRLLIEAAPTDPPTAQKMPQIKFAIAKSYYDSSDYLRAAELFEMLARQFPESKEGVVAAQLALNSLELMEDYGTLGAVGKTMLADARLGDAKLKQDIQGIVESADKLMVIGATVDPTASSGVLEQLAEGYKETGLGEEALYEAMTRSRDEGNIEAFYRTGEEFLKRYPKSNKAVAVLTSLASVASDRADFGQAARWLEESFRIDASAKDAADRLRAAAAIRAYFGEDQAADDIKALATRGASVGDILLILARTGNLTALGQAVADSSVSGPIADFMRGYLAYRRGEGDEAASVLSPVAQLKGGDPATTEVIAKARFILGELAFDFFAAPSEGEEDIVEAIGSKARLLAEVDRAYALAIEGRVGTWALAAVARVAEAYRHFAEFLESARLPDSVSAEERQQLGEAIKAKAAEARARAAELREQCAKRAGKLLVFSDVVRSCLSEQPIPQQIPVFVQVSVRGGAEPPGAADLRGELQKSPTSAKILQRLAELYLGAGDAAMALLVLDRIDSAGETSSESSNLRGVALQKVGEPDAAFGAFKRAVDLDSANGKARLNLAAHYAFYGYVAQAKSELAKSGLPPVVRGEPSEHPELGSLQAIAGAGGKP
ncbi:MAG: tetratricopeptide repeat protein [Pseudomonadota bacterium]